MELYRVYYVRVCDRKVETVDLETLTYLQRASHAGIRITSYKKATERQVELYLKAHPEHAPAAPAAAPKVDPLDMPAVEGGTVTQAHVNYCAKEGHAVHTKDGVVTELCPRCGDHRVKVYLAVFDTKLGLIDVELIGVSSERAANRARWSLIHGRQYGDVDQVVQISVEEIECLYMAMCENTATRILEMPETFGEDGERNDTRIPVCQRCYDFYERQGKPTA